MKMNIQTTDSIYKIPLVARDLTTGEIFIGSLVSWTVCKGKLSVCLKVLSQTNLLKFGSRVRVRSTANFRFILTPNLVTFLKTIQLFLES